MHPRRSFNFAPYLHRWQLEPDGQPIATRCSDLLPVRSQGRPAMLKVAHEAEEKFGGLLMQWWDGDGAARVLAWDADALLLERLQGTRSLVDWVHAGLDDEASRTICGVAARLHAPRCKPLPDLIPLREWFAALEPGADQHGGILRQSAGVAAVLLDDQRDVCTLHGDLHHENVLDTGDDRGWLAIDPKRLIGDRGFDFANILCNPERDLQIVTSPGRLLRQLDVIAEAARYDRHRLLQWLLAYAGLSAAWIFGDGVVPKLELAVAEIAAAELAAIEV